MFIDKFAGQIGHAAQAASRDPHPPESKSHVGPVRIRAATAHLRILDKESRQRSMTADRGLVEVLCASERESPVTQD